MSKFDKVKWNIKLLGAVFVGTASLTALMYLGQAIDVMGKH